ncbi:MAG TPA: hypothetical protein VGC67_14120 [Cellulomonas sp.]
MTTVAPPVEPVPEQASRHGRRVAAPGAWRHRLAVVAATGAVLLAVGLHLTAALSAQTPIWSDDEIGPLATSRLIAGVGQPLSLDGMSYYPGWAVVLAPLWWFISDPTTAYRAAVLMSAGAACLTIWPLSAIARRLSVSRPVAVLLAALVMAGPARVVLSDYAVSEAFFALMVVTSVWLGLRYVERGTSAAASLLALSAAYTFFSHGRGVILPIAVVGLLAGRARRRTWRPAAIGLVLLVGACVTLFSVHRMLAATLYGTGRTREDAAFSTFVSGLTGPLAAGLAGQAWYTIVAWVFLPVFGVAAMVPRLRREWSDRMPAGAAWIAVVVLGALATGTLATADTIGETSGRLDVSMYGRYIDPFLLPLVVVGLAAVARGIERRRGAIAWGGGVVLLGAFLLLGAPLADTDGLWFPMNIAGLLLWHWPVDAGDTAVPFLLASLAVAGFGALVVLAGRQLRWVSVALVAVLLAISSWTAQTEVALPWNEASTSGTATAEVLDQVEEALGEQVDVAYYAPGSTYSGQNFTQFMLIPRTVRVIDSVEAADRSEVVIARLAWDEGEEVGARRLTGLVPGEDALWVLPGALANRLAAIGYLEPERGEVLDSPLYAARVQGAVADLVRIGAEDQSVTVELTNLGDQTWAVPSTSDVMEGTVRLVATWTQDGVDRDVVTDLPQSVFPGRSTQVELSLTVPEGVLPGHVTVRLWLVQEGIEPLGDPVNGPVVLDLLVR